jgi:integrase
MNNKVPQITFIYNRYKTASSTKPAIVEMRITYNYKQKYISTGVMLYPHQWKKGIITNVPDAVQLSKTLDKMLNDVRQILYDMMNEGKIDIFSIPEKLAQMNHPKISFLEFCNQRSVIRKYGKKQDSQERYNRFIKLFSTWGKITEFDDITDKNIIDYDKYLESTGMKPYSKWNNYHRFLNSFILDAIDEGYLKRNPYKWININKSKQTKGIERCLSPEEFIKIKTAKLSTESLERVRDLFIFQVYTCLSYSDLKEFDSKMVQEVKGVNTYVGKRHKTDITFTIPLLSPALDILHKYDGKLPVISNVKYNLYLKAVAQAAEIDKPISSHWARHTGATLLLNEGVPMQIVSKICGHSSTKITEQVYAKLLDETVVDAVTSIKI